MRAAVWAGFGAASRALATPPAARRFYRGGQPRTPAKWFKPKLYSDEDVAALVEKKARGRGRWAVDPESKGERKKRLKTPLDRWRYDLETGPLQSDVKQRRNEGRAKETFQTIHPITKGRKMEIAIRDAALRFDACREQALKAAALSKIQIHTKRHVHGREAAHVLLYEALVLKQAESQFLLGLLLHKGLGVTYDESRAAQLYAMAAAQGHAVASFNFAVFVLRGRGVDRDPELAAKHFIQAAEAGVPQGQYALGICYMVGFGVARDVQKAAEWMASAVQAGHTPHQQWRESRSHAMQTPKQKQMPQNYDLSGADLEIDMSMDLSELQLAQPHLSQSDDQIMPDDYAHDVEEGAGGVGAAPPLRQPDRKELLEFIRAQEQAPEDDDEWAEWGEVDLGGGGWGRGAAGGGWQKPQATKPQAPKKAESGKAVGGEGAKGAVGVRGGSVTDMLRLLEEEEEERRGGGQAGQGPESTSGEAPARAGGERAEVAEFVGLVKVEEGADRCSSTEEGADRGSSTEEGADRGSSTPLSAVRAGDADGARGGGGAGPDPAGDVRDWGADIEAGGRGGEGGLGERESDRLTKASAAVGGEGGGESFENAALVNPRDEIGVGWIAVDAGSEGAGVVLGDEAVEGEHGGRNDVLLDDVQAQHGVREDFEEFGERSAEAVENSVDEEKLEKQRLARRILAEVEEEEEEESRRAQVRLGKVMRELDEARRAKDAARTEALLRKLHEMEKEEEGEAPSSEDAERLSAFLKETGLENDREFLEKYDLDDCAWPEAPKWSGEGGGGLEFKEETPEQREAYARAMKAMGVEEKFDEGGNFQGFTKASGEKGGARWEGPHAGRGGGSGPASKRGMRREEDALPEILSRFEGWKEDDDWVDGDQEARGDVDFRDEKTRLNDWWRDWGQRFKATGMDGLDNNPREITEGGGREARGGGEARGLGDGYEEDLLDEEEDWFGDNNEVGGRKGRALDRSSRSRDEARDDVGALKDSAKDAGERRNSERPAAALNRASQSRDDDANAFEDGARDAGERHASEYQAGQAVGGDDAAVSGEGAGSADAEGEDLWEDFDVAARERRAERAQTKAAAPVSIVDQDFWSDLKGKKKLSMAERRMKTLREIWERENGAVDGRDPHGQPKWGTFHAEREARDEKHGKKLFSKIFAEEEKTMRPTPTLKELVKEDAVKDLADEEEEAWGDEEKARAWRETRAAARGREGAAEEDVWDDGYAEEKSRGRRVKMSNKATARGREGALEEDVWDDGFVEETSQGRKVTEMSKEEEEEEEARALRDIVRGKSGWGELGKDEGEGGLQGEKGSRLRGRRTEGGGAQGEEEGIWVDEEEELKAGGQKKKIESKAQEKEKESASHDEDEELRRLGEEVPRVWGGVDDIVEKKMREKRMREKQAEIEQSARQESARQSSDEELRAASKEGSVPREWGGVDDILEKKGWKSEASQTREGGGGGGQMPADEGDEDGAPFEEALARHGRKVVRQPDSASGNRGPGPDPNIFPKLQDLFHKQIDEDFSAAEEARAEAARAAGEKGAMEGGDEAGKGEGEADVLEEALRDMQEFWKEFDEIPEKAEEGAQGAQGSFGSLKGSGRASTGPRPRTRVHGPTKYEEDELFKWGATFEERQEKYQSAIDDLLDEELGQKEKKDKKEK